MVDAPRARNRSSPRSRTRAPIRRPMAKAAREARPNEPRMSMATSLVGVGDSVATTFRATCSPGPPHPAIGSIASGSATPSIGRIYARSSEGATSPLLAIVPSTTPKCSRRPSRARRSAKRGDTTACPGSGHFFTPGGGAATARMGSTEITVTCSCPTSPNVSERTRAWALSACVFTGVVAKYPAARSEAATPTRANRPRVADRANAPSAMSARLICRYPCPRSAAAASTPSPVLIGHAQRVARPQHPTAAHW